MLDDSITSVGDGFDGLPELTTVWIGENVTGFVRPFTQCPKLVEINVSEKNAYFESVDGVLFAEDGAGNLVRLYRNRMKIRGSRRRGNYRRPSFSQM